MSIERLLDSVAWKPLAAPEDAGDLPYATHQGVLTIGDVELLLYQLSTGERIFPVESLAALFELTEPES
jgi:hypothetical protein